MVLLVGLLVGRWWFIPIAGIGWAVLLLADGTCDLRCSPGAWAFAAVNATVGVAIRKAVVTLIRFARRVWSAPS